MLLDLLKAGGILAGVIVTVGIFIVMFKYVLPVLVALRPANGNKESAGPMFLLLQQASAMPAEIGKLSAMIETLMHLVWTKDEVMREMEKNRHDVANKVTEPLDKLTTALEKSVAEMRRATKDRRGHSRYSRDRRRKK